LQWAHTVGSQGTPPVSAAALPQAPGVYRFRDLAGRVLYIGRAVSLRRRVLSYWGDLGDRAHLAPMVARIARVEAVTCDSAHEAAWLERNLLEHRRPPWNRTLGGQEAGQKRVGQSRQFPLILIARRRPGIRAGGGMGVDLAQPFGQMPDQSGQPFAGHGARPGQAENRIRRRNPGPAKTPPETARERRRQRRHAGGFVRLDLRQHGLRLQRHARALHAIALADLHHQARDGGVQVEVLMRIDMVKRESRGGKGRELGLDLGPKLGAHFG